ncbi:transposase [Azospirillum argentinense]
MSSWRSSPPYQPVTEAARRLGVHESLLYRWRGLMQSSGTAVADTP